MLVIICVACELETFEPIFLCKLPPCTKRSHPHATPPGPIIPTGSYECFIDDWVMHILMFLFLNWSTNAVFQIAQSWYFTDLSPEGDSYRQLFERQVQLTFISSLKPRSIIGQLFYLLKSTTFSFFFFFILAASFTISLLICLRCLYFIFFYFYSHISLTILLPLLLLHRRLVF